MLRRPGRGASQRVPAVGALGHTVLAANGATCRAHYTPLRLC